jgi:REP element-mobilizing transposase RayT
MAAERMTHPPTVLDDRMIDAVAMAVANGAAASDWRVAAAAIERTHMHLLLTATSRDVERTVKWISQQTTKAVHRETAFAGPVWSEGRWLEYVFDDGHWENLRRYIERHNERRGLPAAPWQWVDAAGAA